MKIIFLTNSIIQILITSFCFSQNSIINSINLVYVTGDEFENGRMGHWIFNPEGAETGPELQYYDDTQDEIEFSNDPQFYMKGIINLIAHQSPNQNHLRSNLCPSSFPFNFQDPYYYFPYVSSKIVSKQLFKHGYFEMSFIPPSGLGFWPAFWLSIGNPNLEIDIFEMQGDHMEFFKSDIHCNVPSGCNGQSQTHHLSSGQYFTDGPHTIGLYWGDNDYLTWYLDGVNVRSLQHHFSLAMPVIADLAVGSWCTGFPGPPNVSTVFPGKFKIDYIRVYYPMDCTNTINLQNYYYDINNSSVITGSVINLAGNQGAVLIRGPNWNDDYSRHYGDYVSFIASDQINVYEGFETELGGVVDLQAKSCNDHAISRLVSEESNNVIPQFITLEIDSKNINNDTNHVVDNSEPFLDDSLIVLFPNPTTGNFYLKINNDTEKHKIQIFNCIGQEILNLSEVSSIIELDLKEFPNGIYYLYINTNERHLRKKIILNH